MIDIRICSPCSSYQSAKFIDNKAAASNSFTVHHMIQQWLQNWSQRLRVCLGLTRNLSRLNACKSVAVFFGTWVIFGIREGDGIQPYTLEHAPCRTGEHTLIFQRFLQVRCVLLLFYRRRCDPRNSIPF